MSSFLPASGEKTAENYDHSSILNDSQVTEDVVQQSSPSTGESPIKTAWLVGDIVWSKIPGHPWWPSMVAYEPNTAVYFKYSGRTRYYHVQFFGHEPMRGWATEKSIILYQGKDHFLSLRLSTHGKIHKVGSKQLPLWETAVKMADRALPLNRHERKLCFTFKYQSKEEQDMSDGQSPLPEMPNGFVKSKTDTTSCEKSKASKKTKTKQQIGGTEKVSDDTAPGKTDSNFQPICKKSKVDAQKVENKLAAHAENLTKVKQHPKRLNKPKQSDKETKSVTSKQNQGRPSTPKITNGKKEPSSAESPTSLKLKMKRIDGVDLVTGKRKRGRPRKDSGFVIVNGADPNVSADDLNNSAKKLKTVTGNKTGQSTAKNTLNNNVIKPLMENEKSEVASDSNSIASTDLEAKTEHIKVSSKQKELVCVVCEQPDNLVLCEGVCNSAYHMDCLGLNCKVPDKFTCDECTSGNHTCFICRKTSNVVQCSTPLCGKFYHIDCVKSANIKVEGEKFTCPLHFCNVCGPRKAGSYKRRLTCCTRCPIAYHTGTCIVAGCLPITSHYLVCKRHFLADKKKAHHSHVNVNWCFVCSIGGILICCESCPAAFHAECIDVTEIPEGHFFCRDCTSGKELLYGEIVWVKLGMYRWWPAQICNPNNIPTNIQNLHHQPGEFPVQFLGSHDYYWIHRGRVFSYQEGDKGSCSAGGKYLGNVFKKALVEAKERYAEWQKAQEEKAEKDLEKLSKKPAPYKHLKVNRYTTATRYEVDESEWSVCECSVNDENPCGPDSHCLNRILLVECSPSKCPAKEKCQNQCFVKRQYLACEPFRTKGCGWGLNAKEDAKKGQFIIEYVGELINEATCRERVTKGSDEGVMNYYMLTIDKDCIIDAGPMGNLARFMNHSCNPNCETQKWTVNGEIRVGLFAKRDIMAGEELLFDYQLDCLGNEKKKCNCGSENCSGFLGVRPKTQHAQLQEEKKKKSDLKKKKKTKKNQIKDGSSQRDRQCSLPGEQQSKDVHLGITPEAFLASELELDRNPTVIEKILVSPSMNNKTEELNDRFKQDEPKARQDTVNQLNETTVTLDLNQSENQLLNPSLPCSSSDFSNTLRPLPSTDGLNKSTTLPSTSSFLNFSPPNKSVTELPAPGMFPSFLINTPPTPYSSVSSVVAKANPYIGSGPSISGTLSNTSTFSQFAPKNFPVVSHAFHNIATGLRHYGVTTGACSSRVNQTGLMKIGSNPVENRSNLSNFSFVNPVWPSAADQGLTTSISTSSSTINDDITHLF